MLSYPLASIQSWLFAPKTNPDESWKQLFCSAVLSTLIYKDENDWPSFRADLLRFQKSFSSIFNPQQGILSERNSSTSFCIVEFEAFIIVAIRGSWTQTDWISNVDINKVDFFQDMKAHSGFKSGFDDIPLIHVIQHATETKKTLIFTGHSRGGAIAQLCAGRVLLSNPQAKVLCYTFGSPLVSTKAWQKALGNFDANFRHYILKNDPVPYVVGHADAEFQPAGKIIQLGEHEGITVEAELDFQQFQKKLMDKHTAYGVFQRMLEGFADHKMDNYKTAIINICKQHFPSTSDRMDDEPSLPKMSFPAMQVDASYCTVEDKVLTFELTGKNLASCLRVTMNYFTRTNNANENNNSNGQTSLEVFSVAGNPVSTPTTVTVKFQIPKNKSLYSSKVELYLTDNLSVLKKEIIIPFKRVLLMGQTGAGKTLLKAALQDVEFGKAPHTVPRTALKVDPTVHTQMEKKSEGNRVIYQEWEGFIQFSEEEVQEAKDNLFSDLPIVIVVVVNASNVMLTSKTSKGTRQHFLLDLASSIQRETKGSVLVLYAITALAKVAEHTQEETKQHLEKTICEYDNFAQTESRIFWVNTDPIYVTIQGKKHLIAGVQGVDTLFNAIRTRLDGPNATAKPEMAMVLRNTLWEVLKNYITDPTVASTALAVVVSLLGAVAKEALKK